MNSNVVATGVIADPDTDHAYLVVEVAIDCPLCGKTTVRLTGHHLKAVRDIAQSYCDQFPALTGGAVTLVSSTEFSTPAAQNPENN